MQGTRAFLLVSWSFQQLLLGSGSSGEESLGSGPPCGPVWSSGTLSYPFPSVLAMLCFTPNSCLSRLGQPELLGEPQSPCLTPRGGELGMGTGQLVQDTNLSLPPPPSSPSNHF